MDALIFHVISWPTLGCALLAYGFTPGALLRLIVLLYPRNHPRRRELIGELYAYPRIKRLFWVAEQLETALFEGLGGRIAAQRAKRMREADAGGPAAAIPELGGGTYRAGGGQIEVWEAHLARIADNRAHAARRMEALRQKLNDPFMRDIADADSLRTQLDHLQHRNASLRDLEQAYRRARPARRGRGQADRRPGHRPGDRRGGLPRSLVP